MGCRAFWFGEYSPLPREFKVIGNTPASIRMLPSTGAQPITFATDQNPSNWIVEFQEGYPLGKEIPMEYLFFDIENVALETIEEVTEIIWVYVLSVDKQTRFD